MALPRFFERVTHSIISAAGPVDCATVAQHAEDKSVRAVAAGWINDVDGHSEGFITACNLLARTYPAIVVDAPEPILSRAVETILAINPGCDINPRASTSATLTWGVGATSATEVCCCASGCNALLDDAVVAEPTACSPLAAMAAACIGVAEVFRAVFGELTQDQRDGGKQVAWNLLTLKEPEDTDPALFQGVDVGELTLVGCGAIGEAFVAGLRAAHSKGRLIVVDPEDVELSNLQRYLLTTNGDVAQAKTALAARALEGSEMTVVEECRRWSLETDKGPECMVCALDTAGDRIGCQAALSHRVYNAYTGEEDLGWSRHERFGQDACLACLYWPQKSEVSWTEQVARSLGMEGEAKRVVLYKLSGIAVGEALPPAILQANGVQGDLAAKWASSSLLDDLGVKVGLGEEVKSQWSTKTIDDLYTEGLCGGRLVEVLDHGKNELLLVPLAHESVLAGVMLAVSVLCASRPELRHLRNPDTKAAIRLHGEQALPYTVSPGRLEQCICSDPAFFNRYGDSWADLHHAD